MPTKHYSIAFARRSLLGSDRLIVQDYKRLVSKRRLDTYLKAPVRHVHKHRQAPATTGSDVRAASQQKSPSDGEHWIERVRVHRTHEQSGFVFFVPACSFDPNEST